MSKKWQAAKGAIQGQSVSERKQRGSAAKAARLRWRFGLGRCAHLFRNWAGGIASRLAAIALKLEAIAIILVQMLFRKRFRANLAVRMRRFSGSAALQRILRAYPNDQ